MGFPCIMKSTKNGLYILAMREGIRPSGAKFYKGFKINNSFGFELEDEIRIWVSSYEVFFENIKE